MSVEIFSKLEEVASTLPKQFQENAVALVQKMQSVVSGIGDRDRDWRPSGLKVIQPTTQNIPDGAKIGSMVIGDRVINDSFDVYPLRVWGSRQFWDPNPSSAQMLCQSPDAIVGMNYGKCKDCPHSVFKEGEGSDCNKSKTFMVVAADLSDVFLINFSKGGYSNGMAWEKLLKLANVAPYRRTYTLKTQPNPKAKQVRNIVAEAAANSRTPAELIPFLDVLFDKVSKDREQHLAKFYEYVQTKNPSSAPALGHEDSGRSGERLIDVKVEESDTQATSTRYQL